MQPIRIIMAGATGKTGREVARGLRQDPELQLVGVVSAKNAGRDLGEVIGPEGAGIPIHANLQAALAGAGGADLFLDFSLAEASRHLIPEAISHGLAPVVGTTGFAPGELQAYAAQCQARGLGGAFIANFAIGVMLMMRFAEEARRFFPQAQIIEYHHATKLDNPSGTALRTKERLERAYGDLTAPQVPVYGVRLPGFVAHQEVIFGGLGQVLTIRHDAPGRDSYVPGVAMTCKWVLKEKRIAFDLEEIAYPG